MNETLHFTPDLDQELMAKVALISSSWQFVENDIDHTIWGLLNVEQDQGISVTAHMTFPLKCDVLKSLYHTEFEDDATDKSLSKLIESVLKPAKSKRDKFAHALWLKNDKGETVFLEKQHRARPRTKPRPITISNLTTAESEIVCALVYFRNFTFGQLDYRVFPQWFADKVPEILDELKSQDGPVKLEFRRHPAKPEKPRPPPLPVPE